MNIKARTKYNQEVTIVSFVVRYNTVLAIVVDARGHLHERLLADLTVVEKL